MSFATGLRQVWKLAILFVLGVAMNIQFGSILMLPKFSFLRRTTILIGLTYDFMRNLPHSRSTTIAVLVTTLGALSISLRVDLLNIDDLWGYILVLLDNFISVLQGLEIVSLLKTFNLYEIQFFRSILAIPVVSGVLLMHYETTFQSLTDLAFGQHLNSIPFVIISSVLGYLLNYYLIQLFNQTSAMGVGFCVNIKNNVFHCILFIYNLMQKFSFQNGWMLFGVSISLIGNFLYIQENRDYSLRIHKDDSENGNENKV